MKKDCKQGLDEAQSFILHESTIRMSSQLKDLQLGRLIRYFYLYATTGQTPDEEKNLAVKIIFDEWRLRYDLDKQQYQTVCRKRSEAGRKGLAKRWDKTDATEKKLDTENIDTHPSLAPMSSITPSTPTTPMTLRSDEGDGILSMEKGGDSLPLIANDSIAIPAIANVADNDSESDSESKKETSPEGEAKKRVSLPRSSCLGTRKSNSEASNNTLEARKSDFYQSILPFIDHYDREMLNDFYQYWTELDKRRRRMRFEMQKTWETGKRLATWQRRQSPNFS